MNVPIEYNVGVSRGSIPSFDRMNSGPEVDIKVATVE